MESKQFSFLELFWYIYVSLELWAHWTTLFPRMCLPCPALTVCRSLSDGRHPEYTEVPLGALDIAAADSLTLSPHNGKFKMDVCRSFMCLSSPCSPQSLQYETKLQHYCLFKAMITVIRNLVWFSAKPKKACDLWKVKDGENKAAFSADQRVFGVFTSVSPLQKEVMQETQSGWRNFLCAAAGWRLHESKAPATASADSVWPLKASTERFVSC